jgi:ABC-type Zn uptake system ZnuABC Zn-binding protein ZnuA
MSLKIIDQLQEAIKQEERIANKNARKHKERIAKLEKKLLQAFEALPVLPSIVASENIKELQ